MIAMIYRLPNNTWEYQDFVQWWNVSTFSESDSWPASHLNIYDTPIRNVLKNVKDMKTCPQMCVCCQHPAEFTWSRSTWCTHWCGGRRSRPAAPQSSTRCSSRGELLTSASIYWKCAIVYISIHIWPSHNQHMWQGLNWPTVHTW